MRQILCSVLATIGILLFMSACSKTIKPAEGYGRHVNIDMSGCDSTLPCLNGCFHPPIFVAEDLDDLAE